MTRTAWIERLLVAGVLFQVSGVMAAEVEFEIERLVNNLNEGIAVADVNNDGHLDVIAGPFWYQGPMWRQHFLRPVREVGGEFIENNGDHALDLNGNGWVDVIAGSWFDDKLYWYKNPGKDALLVGKAWERHEIISGRGECEATMLVDMDGDGQPELIPNHWNEARSVIIIRIEPGKDGADPTFTPFEVAPRGNSHGMGIGDLSGDGRPDIVFGHGWFEAPSDGSIYEGGWKYHKAFDFMHNAVPSIIADVNGNGKNDVISGKGHDYGVVWFEQGDTVNGEITWTKHVIDDSFSQAHCMAWADLDGDGRPELITGKRYRGHGGSDPGADDPVCLMRYWWNPQKQAFERQVISKGEGVGAGMQIRVADLSKNGKLDIAVAGKTGTYVLMNRGLKKGGRGDAVTR